jgi:hypothetical protein
MSIHRVALTLLALSASPAAAAAPGWMLGTADSGGSALVFGTPGQDRDAFQLYCNAGKLTLTTWTGGPPRGVSDPAFPTTLNVFFGRREILYPASGQVTGPGNLTRIDAPIPDAAAFLTSLDGVSRLTTVIYAGRRMAVTPTPAQTADFRKACGF